MCTCEKCRTCLHRNAVRRAREINKRFVGPCSLEGHSEILVASGDLQSTWPLVEEALYRMFGPPTSSQRAYSSWTDNLDKARNSDAFKCGAVKRSARASRFITAWNKQKRLEYANNNRQLS